jgi:hypothetical protein
VLSNQCQKGETGKSNPFSIQGFLKVAATDKLGDGPLYNSILI